MKIGGLVVTRQHPMTARGTVFLALEDETGMVNVTLCFSPVQAWMAAKAGATFISPFIGRVDDAGEDGIGLIRDIRARCFGLDSLGAQPVEDIG